MVIVVNLLSEVFHFRLDFTEGNQYTLSKATKRILNHLEDPVTVKAYFSKNLPPEVQKVRQDFQEILIEYANLANGMLIFKFIDPNESEANEREAAQSGIQPVMLNIREKDQVKQQKAFLGVSVSQGENIEAIPIIRPGAAMEFSLSMAIKKISTLDKETIGFLRGHGEPPLSEMQQLGIQLQVLYNSVEVFLSDTSSIPDNLRTLAIIAPRDTFPIQHINKLDQFVKKGGNLILAINRVEGSLQSNYGRQVQTGLENWLLLKGIEISPEFVVDANCATITVEEQQGVFTLQSEIAFPYLPIISKFSGHPISTGLETVVFEFASPVKYIGDTSNQFTPLLFSSEMSNSLSSPQYFDIQKEWTEQDLPLNGVVLGAVLEGNNEGNAQGKLVIFSDGDFIVNGPEQQAQPVQPDNVNLFSNALDWLSDDTGLIELRTKTVTSRPIDELTDSTKTILKYMNFGLPLFLVVFYGILRFQKNRKRRLMRSKLNYEED